VFEYYAGAIGKFYGQTIPVARGGFDFTLRQSMGVVAAIVPWNFPFPIACWKVAPALAAGNCVVLKPASLSPLTALKLGELAHAAGLPPGVLQVLSGSGSAIGDAIRTALNGFDPNRNSQKVIVVVTDGEDTESDPLAAAKDAASFLNKIGWGKK
jgi:acyl-CoA reductase-like NAD-dependent aldehyde dehydrogenase